MLNGSRNLAQKSGTAILLFLLMSFAKPSASFKVKPVLQGTLLLQYRPAEVDSFFSGDSIRISYVRNVCNFLTDDDIDSCDGYALPKRKKAFVRHIKQLYETVERSHLKKRKADTETEEIFYELALYYESFRQKGMADNKTVSRKDQYRMFRDSRRSKRVFQYRNTVTDHEAANIDQKNLRSNPEDSPFWHDTKKNYTSFYRFDYLANLKKIDADNEMIVLFDKASLSGSSPKIDVKDRDLDNEWSVKWGDEIHTDIAGSRIFAELGYDVDHPYYFGANQLTIIFDQQNEIKNADDLKKKIKEVYDIDLAPFISAAGIVSEEICSQQNELREYIGRSYVRFLECSMEGRPDRVKRLGSFLPGKVGNADRRELRGALLAHQWIGNWDTREENTMLSVVHMGNYRYRASGVFSDLGTGFGISKHLLPADFKVGLVNEFEWEIAHEKNGIVYLDGEINSILPCYAKATYSDLFWMANKIAAIDSSTLRYIIDRTGWSDPVAELYFHKLASRRASILKAFHIEDPHPVSFNKLLNIKVLSSEIVRDGKLITDSEKQKHPESFLLKRGRFRNYGH